MHKLLFAAGSRVNLAPARVSTTVPLDPRARYQVTICVLRSAIKKKKKKGGKQNLASLCEMNRDVALLFPHSSLARVVPLLQSGLRYIKRVYDSSQFSLQDAISFESFTSLTVVSRNDDLGVSTESQLIPRLPLRWGNAYANVRGLKQRRVGLLGEEHTT